MGKQKKKSDSPISDNRKARFNFEITDKYEAGLSLLGWETKSIRENKAQIAQVYTTRATKRIAVGLVLSVA